MPGKVPFHKVPLDDELRAAIKDCCLRILENCADLIEEGSAKFREERFPRSCFLAMTAIEEAGKLSVLRLVARAELEQLGTSPRELDVKGLCGFLRDHPKKARQAAAWSLHINAGADRRHGNHPVSGIHRTSGLILLVRSGQWMSIRNSCLYVNLQFRPPKIEYPRAEVSKGLAFYMTCMAYEVVADQAYAIDDASGCFEFEKAQIAKLQEFMNIWGASSDIDALPFLAAPQQLRNQFHNKEA